MFPSPERGWSRCAVGQVWLGEGMSTQGGAGRTNAAAPPLPRAFWLVWTGTLINRLGQFVEPFLVLYLTTQRGFTPAHAGVALVCFGAGSAVSQVLGGWLTDHVGRRPTLAGGMVVCAASNLALGASRGFVAICVAAAVAGIGSDLYRPASTALVTDLVGPEQRRRAFALIFWAVNLGFAFASVAAGFLAEQGYTLLFVLDAATCLLYAGIIWWGLRADPLRPSSLTDDSGRPPAGYRTAVRDPLMLALVAITLVQATVYMQVTTTLPLAIVGHGLSTSTYGLVAALNGILIVVLQPFAPRVLGRFDSFRVLAVSNVLIGLGFGLTAFASTLLGFGGTVAVWTLGEIAGAGLMVALIADLAPPEARGRYAAVWGTAFGVSSLLAPAVGTSTYQFLGPNVLWAGCFVAGLLAAAGCLALGPAFRRRVDSDTGPGWSGG
jgi:MFS family permease